ncbi:NeuD/PglB/VioB family sugar acetyltransferase [Oceanicella sp. SM1341]|uniref:NeuD/PglB/VioB family sugar acetyltransferase n=1 Tax=Oceanicella sp. SM1341 TaxID=1548889 RepID=UPI000E4E4745|nr:NeuD/PglB/VioB family sugar acetyltransferase [Oceanicella sp. SM1341]
MDRPEIVVVGFSGNALEALDMLEAGYRIAAFLDDAPALRDTRFEGIPIRPIAALADYPSAQVVVMVGSERSFRRRGALISGLGLPPGRWARLVHPTAVVSRLAWLGRGAVLFANVVVGPGARIGDHVMVLPNTVVHHDSEIGDFSLLGANVTVAGRCRVGQGCYIGSAASLRDGIEIGAGALVGMAANVVRPVAACSVVAGNPARPR